jgi:hypothetical protein
MCEAHRKMRYAIDRPQLAAEAVKSGGTGDWRSGSALRSHRRGHWFDPSIAHTGRGRFQTKEPASFMWLQQQVQQLASDEPLTELAGHVTIDLGRGLRRVRLARHRRSAAAIRKLGRWT